MKWTYKDMSTVKVRAIVLKNMSLKEKDKLVCLYSLELGKIYVSMKGVRGEKAKLKSAKEIFCFGEFILEQTKTNYIVTGVDIIYNFYNLTKDIDKYYEGCAILDIVDKVESQPNPPLFIEIIKALKTLCYDDVKKYYCICKFLIDIFAGMGYNFITSECSSCKSQLLHKYFNLDFGELVCPACRTALCVPISEACYSSLKILNMIDYEKLKNLKLNEPGTIEAYKLLCKNFEWRTNYQVLDIK